MDHSFKRENFFPRKYRSKSTWEFQLSSQPGRSLWLKGPLSLSHSLPQWYNPRTHSLESWKADHPNSGCLAGFLQCPMILWRGPLKSVTHLPSLGLANRITPCSWAGQSDCPFSPEAGVDLPGWVSGPSEVGGRSWQGRSLPFFGT